MSMADWFSMVSPSGGIRYELLDRDAPTAWVIDVPGHRATYRGRVMEDRTDERGRLTRGVLRRMELSFDLSPSVHCGPGTGHGPPAPPPTSPSVEEDPAETEPAVAAAPVAPPPATAIAPTDVTSSSRLVQPRRESVVPSASRLLSFSSPHGYRVDPLMRVVEEDVLTGEVDVETGSTRAVRRTVRREVMDLDTEMITVDSDSGSESSGESYSPSSDEEEEDW
ncbi:uncharacterized protein LOC130715107 isoform X1 [Lotus japonicus]|uniref:uncharacterized protein LOC130715107 isoform X1 n=1 Tax=Lotus japonicus TaxID=34305 RepID=UPI00258BAE53|nr:uncharacterized protein LOC130715107 isoform X1 [Lotus japonicus]XP_057421136.1 uncharacterized protein LOC130715107 isoform X1 [Lotus japonicus]